MKEFGLTASDLDDVEVNLEAANGMDNKISSYCKKRIG